MKTQLLFFFSILIIRSGPMQPLADFITRINLPHDVYNGFIEEMQEIEHVLGSLKKQVLMI